MDDSPTPTGDIAAVLSTAALDTLDAPTVTRVARAALGDAAATVERWEHEPIPYPASNPVSGGLFRLQGTARATAGIRAWAAVLKVVRPPTGVPDGSDDPTHPFYWRRELEAYRSGLLTDLSRGLAAPRCFGVEARPDGSVWLWLEAIRDEYDGR